MAISIRMLTTDRLDRGGDNLMIAKLVLFGAAMLPLIGVGFGDLADSNPSARDGGLRARRERAADAVRRLFRRHPVDFDHEVLVKAPAGEAVSGEAATLGRLIATGAAAALIFAIIAYTLRAWTGLQPFAASGAAHLAAFAFAYTTQRRWTFGGRHSHGRAFPRYLAAQLFCLALSAALSQLLSAGWGASPLVMACSTTIAVSAVSFALSRFWVFADSGTA